MYRLWSDRLPADLEVCAIQLPGRERRIREPAFTEIPRLVRALADALPEYLGVPFAFFGHSMGALVCFELARLLCSERGLCPVGLFVAGHRAPQHPATDAGMRHLGDREFIAELRSIGGTPEAALEQPELMELLLQPLRADITACETYTYTPGPPLDYPITAFGGLEDQYVSAAHLAGWAEHTTRGFALRLLPGGHFFVDASQERLLAMLGEDLRDWNRLAQARVDTT
jgi:medium-chain acyl-[acyl-carrier-protein] hydrolase